MRQTRPVTRTPRLASRLLTAGLLSLALAPAARAGGSGASPAPALTPTSCAYPLSATLRERGARCLTLRVPERHARPAGRQISLFVVVVPGQAPSPRLAPVVYLHGGPGGSVEREVYGMNREDLAAASGGGDLILFDQRGTGASRPVLGCSDTRPEAERAAQLQTQGYGLLRNDFAAAVRACRASFDAANVDVTAYTSAESAADVEALRRALKVPQVNLYGVSYGTRLAQEVMRRFPGSVRSAVLDSPLPTGRNYTPWEAALLDRALKARLQACTDDPVCAETYPNIQERFAALLERLDRDPLPVTLFSEESGRVYPLPLRSGDLLRLLFWQLYRGGTPAEVIGLVNALSRGITGDAGQLLSWDLWPRDINLTQLAVQCPETSGLPAPAATAGMRADARTEAALRPLNQTMQQVCAEWPRAGDAALRQPVRSEIPTLILTGELDPVTPPGYGREVHALLPNSQWVNFRWNSHGQRGACFTRLLGAFWKNPRQPLEAGCAADRP